MPAVAFRVVSALLLAIAAGSSLAQGWPSKPIRWIVPYPPGGSDDIATRTVTERLTRMLGQAVVVENRPGATGTIGAEYVAKSTADGYTVLSGSDAMTSVPHLYSKLGFDPLKDFVPVTQLTRQPVLLAAHPSLGVNSVAELVGLAKMNPGLAYASGGGSGSPQHMVAEWFASLAGIKGLILEQWYGVFVPAGTSKEIVGRLNAGTVQALADPKIRERYAQSGLEPVGGTSEQFAAVVRADYDKYGRLIRELKITVD